MERFQRTKYLNRLAEVRRELAGWIGTYRTMGLAENAQSFTERQLALADNRRFWLEDLVEQLEGIEEALSDGPSTS